MSPQSSLFDFEADGLRDLFGSTDATRDVYVETEVKSSIRQFDPSNGSISVSRI